MLGKLLRDAGQVTGSLPAGLAAPYNTVARASPVGADG